MSLPKDDENWDLELFNLLRTVQEYQKVDREREYVIALVDYAEYLMEQEGLPMKAMADLLALGNPDTMFHMLPFFKWKYGKRTSPVTEDDVANALEEADRIVKDRGK